MLDRVDARLTTRQLWILLAVAQDRVDRRAMYGGICTLDDQEVSWTLTSLALRGLVAFDPSLLSRPRLTRRGWSVLRSAELRYPQVS